MPFTFTFEACGKQKRLLGASPPFSVSSRISPFQPRSPDSAPCFAQQCCATPYRSGCSKGRSRTSHPRWATP